MNKNVKIGFVSIDSPLDKRSWSGINYMIYSSLKSRFANIEILGPLNNYGLKKILALLNWLSVKLFKKKYNYGHSYIISKLYSYELNKKINKKEFDLLIVVVSSPALSFLKSDAKVIYITDATFKSLVNYYIYDLWEFSIKESNLIEQLALQKSTRVVLPSEWAQKEVFSNYAVPYNKSRVFYFGSNMSNIPQAPILRDVSKLDCFSLLFVGVDWNRKGGDIVLKCLISLHQKGYNIKLTICGCVPPIEHPAIKVYPFLDKNNSEDLRKLEQLYFESHLFILPTRAECAGIVFAEAASYSLPIISTNTGGVPSYVKNNYNGYLLDLHFEFEKYEDLIIKLMEDKMLYKEFSLNSHKLYSDKINWDKFGDCVAQLVDEIVVNN